MEPKVERVFIRTSTEFAAGSKGQLRVSLLGFVVLSKQR